MIFISETIKKRPTILFYPQLYHKEADDGGDEEWVRLTRLYQFARNVRALLHTYHYNQIFLTDFLGAYSKFTGSCLEPRFYGYTNTDDLLNAIPQVAPLHHLEIGRMLAF